MTKNIALFILTLLLFTGLQSNAQWLRNTINTDYIYTQAKKKYDEHSYRAAIDLCKKGLSRSADDIDFRYLLGKSYAAAGKTDSARAEYKEVLEIDNRYKDAYSGLINLEAGLCNYKEAINRADVALYYFPGDTTFLIKKIGLFNQFGNRVEADRISEQLMTDHPTDRRIMDIYTDQHLETAKYYSRRGYLIKAKKGYELVLEQDPQNSEAIEASYSIDLQSGNYENSLLNINRALEKSPRSYELLRKKIGILEKMERYKEAVAATRTLIKYYPYDAEAKKLEAYLRMETGIYYMSVDPYSQFQSVLALEPRNREALNYVINIGTSRGYYNDALAYCNKALKQYPNDPDFMAKKVGILEILQKYHEAAELQGKRLERNPGSVAIKSEYIELLTLSGNQYMKEEMYDHAQADFQKVLKYDPDNYDAQSSLVNLYIRQKRYDAALKLTDKALEQSPGNEEFLFRKVAILQASEKYLEAAEDSEILVGRHPGNERYRNAFIESSMQATKNFMLIYDYKNADATVKKVLDIKPDEMTALHYMINVQSGMKQYDSALYYCDMALSYYPNDREYLLKKSAVLGDMKRYPEAYAISGALYNRYPYNPQYRLAYVDQLLASGRNYNAQGRPEDALLEFGKVLAFDPLDTSALFYTINTQNELKRYDAALVNIETGRRAYPGIPYFLLKRAVVYENLEKWDSAWHAADTLVRTFPVDAKTRDYAEYLHSRTLKNDIGLFYLHSKYNYQSEPSNIATVQYMRYIKNSTLAVRVNYAGRPNGTGFLYEAEGYIQHGKKWMSFINLSYSPDTAVWPRYRGAYSLYRNFNHGWQGELGVRYLQIDPFSIYSGVGSIGKYLGDFFLNLKGFYSFFNDHRYASGLFTSRYYFTESKYDYVQALAGYGVTPDDKSIFYLFDQNYRYKTISVGAGFQKHIKYRTLIGASGMWYNQQMNEVTYRNQYDVYLYIRRRF